MSQPTRRRHTRTPKPTPSHRLLRARAAHRLLVADRRANLEPAPAFSQAGPQ